ncbi:RNA-directed DNA polymerase from transposon BS [Paramuricea clavata]|uniref:RNA-directed DNA polymerase from transposon BS n=1 Tax=Paramuricea clavata TaxID=317549 RepID=A0A6S7FS80_PARCT|nr:RNA-directed DNA polymerase from transposon BS [Paramuricea clavata]
MANLGQEINKKFPTTKLIISELITRNDNQQINTKVKQVNTKLSQLKGFKIVHLNIASLMKHKDELSIFISLQPFDVLCINETRLDSSTYNSEVEIAGCDLIRKDRNRNEGGVAIYVRSVIPYINRTELSPDTAEAICLKIRKPKSKPLLVSTWYRPPGSKPQFFNDFETFLKNIDN